MINSIKDYTYIPLKSLDNNSNTAFQSNNISRAEEYHKNMDTVTFSHNSEATHSSYSNILSTDETQDKGYEMLRKLVTSMLREQGIEYEITITGPSAIDINELSHEEAQELVAADNYFGVEQTSDRIVNFALSLAGGDVDKLDKIKDGVEHGFQEALKAFNGTLPDISYQTFDVVMQKLDAWANEAQSDEA